MSTRSMIARRTADGFETIYCHHDGYPAHHAPILTGHYATDDAVAALLDLGNLSVLGPKIGEAHDFGGHYSNPQAADGCLAYARDRGEAGQAKRATATEEALLKSARESWADYLYLFQDGRWIFRKMRQDETWQEISR